ncbi:hypothetical protein BCU70_21830 [Vibrio sp. 10N.286.49.C2]|uniref:hypothetical protein n=1 Tax=unclassified Vibrio TaxID=2614977 RepID=UPI000C82A78F|nr:MULTISPECIES: hypothetical protein [unclassified Vibrio]PMH30340.1 hypothetical protein BCU70_21830 [Vibrio sp. 10N.286.49.C2]PMH50839.1 hypothetical protein BCU66_17920 [Vibrio sp. 10N.286.49.B1]PMH79551.1 hypothetical protein BCU58_04795 [Vibrio sp. 10N.286.48.B7]
MYRLLLAFSSLALLSACDDTDTGADVTSQSDFVEQYRGQYVGTQLVDGSAVGYQLTVNDGQFYLEKVLDNEASQLTLGVYNQQTGEVTFSELETSCSLRDDTQLCRVAGAEVSMTGRALDADAITIADLDGHFENRLGSVMTLHRNAEVIHLELGHCTQEASVMSETEIQFQAGTCFAKATVSMVAGHTLNQQGDVLYITSSDADLSGYWYK